MPTPDHQPQAHRQSRNGEERLPLIVYYHGGGFVVGSVNLFDAFARSLANATNAVVLSVEYRVAPAFPYPTPVEDAYAAGDRSDSHAVVRRPITCFAAKLPSLVACHRHAREELAIVAPNHADSRPITRSAS